MRTVVATEKAPAAIGPYAQANVIGNFVFTSGQLGMDPATGDLKEGLEAQTHQVFANLKAILEEAGSGLDKVIKTTCFLQSMDDFAAMNAIYATYFEGDMPSRSAFEVARLPKGGLIEIEAIAYL
ncbi:MAG: RidA family protein [Firmicutes bacterium]|nr:RidA family protein [Bacillota bacterium]